MKYAKFKRFAEHFFVFETKKFLVMHCQGYLLLSPIRKTQNMLQLRFVRELKMDILSVYFRYILVIQHRKK